MSCQLAYVNIIEDINCTRIDGVKKIKKTLFEQLTMWRFWDRYKEVPNVIPSSYYVKGENAIICHPLIRAELEEEIERLI